MLTQEDKDLAASWINKSITKRHKKFPDVLYDVDHETLASIAKTFRKKHRIKSKEIADALGLKCSIMSFLENGKTLWTQDLLYSYIYNIKKLSKQFYNENFN